MPYRVVVRRVIEDKSDRLREWARTVKARRVEAEATLRDEGVRLEITGLVKTAQGDLFVGVVDEEDRDRARKTYEKSVESGKHPLDREHEAVMRECLGERLGDGELLYALSGG
jgi:hypothetical protein